MSQSSPPLKATSRRTGPFLAAVGAVLVLIWLVGSVRAGAGQLSGRVLGAHSGRVLDQAFSPDGSTLATCGDDQFVKLWDVASGRLRTVLSGQDDAVERVRFSPDGGILATVGGMTDGEVWLWNPASGQRLRKLRIGDPWVQTGAIEFSADGRLLATGSDDGVARIWEVASGRRVAALAASTGAVTDLAFWKHGTELLTSGGDGGIGVWNLASGRLLATLAGSPRGVYCLRVFAGGTRLASGGSSGDQGAIQVWDPDQGKLLHSYTDSGSSSGGAVRLLAVPEDGRFFGGAAAGSGKPVRIWEGATGRVLADLPAVSAALALSPDARHLAISGPERRLQWFDTGTWKRQAQSAPQPAPFRISLSPDGRAAATGSDDGTVILWAMPR